jgi:hypothetical protein
MVQPALPGGPGLGNLRRTWAFVQNPRQFYAWLRRRYGDVATLRTADAPRAK